MNLDKALHELYEEKKRIDRAIARLESGLAELSDAPPRSRRGRKSMSEEERLQVSYRMTAYWAARRAQMNGNERAAEGTKKRAMSGVNG